MDLFITFFLNKRVTIKDYRWFKSEFLVEKEYL
jgi:hypothetical protein